MLRDGKNQDNQKSHCQKKMNVNQSLDTFLSMASPDNHSIFKRPDDHNIVNPPDIYVIVKPPDNHSVIKLQIY